ncbi:MAG: OmpA family protein [Acidobacteria bacterium]|nr:OmpA family protein [Acidobacteriota bacterium]
MNTKWTVLGLVVVFFTSGCATKKYVEQQVASSQEQVTQRIDQVEGQVEANQTRLDEQEKMIDDVSKTAQDALDRAVAAGQLAEGKFVYEATFTDDQIHFETNEAVLGDEAKAALDAFAREVKSKNENVFIEIQGHTDSTGSDSHNYELGLERAEAVRRHLSSQHGFPLHRISVISYGESEPVADNDTKEGRSANRRVVIVVLK